MRYEQAKSIADGMVEKLSGYCDKIEIAGSVRRKKPEVHDIEIVAIPKIKITYDMFGGFIYSLAFPEEIFCDLKIIKNGPKYKQFTLPEGINLDLFLVYPPVCRKCGIIMNISKSIGASNALQKQENSQKEESGALPQSHLSKCSEDLRSMQKGIRGGASSVSADMRKNLFGDHKLANPNAEGRETRKELSEENLSSMRKTVSEPIIREKADMLKGMSEEAFFQDTSKNIQMGNISRTDGMENEIEAREGGIYSGLLSSASQSINKGSDHGAPVSDGKTLGAISGTIREGSSSKWNKERQSNRKLGDSYTCSSQRDSNMPPLPERIRSPLGCINLDLFIVLEPAQWGVIFTIRTGSADFSHNLVKSKSFGGYLPGDCKVHDGGVYKQGELITMPEEKDFLEFVGLGWIEPEKRQ
jgi:hypothetical protein